MKSILLDTSYFIALANPRDEYHLRALVFSRSNLTPLLTTSAIILELGAKFSRADRRRVFLDILRILHEDRVEIVRVDEELERRGIVRFSERPDKNWSLADCISFIVMEDRGITEAATTDEHFEQAKFIALLRKSAEKNG